MNEYDIAVIGGGAAGLAAALVLARAQRRVAVVDAGEPRNAPAQHMHGYLSRDRFSPTELLRLGREEVTGYGADVVAGRVAAVRRTGDEVPRFEVRPADADVLSARRVLVATGLRDELPDYPGRVRALGPRPAALPVLPRLRGALTATRRCRWHTRGGRPRPPGAAVVARRHAICPHRRASRRPARGRSRDRRGRRSGRPARRRGRRAHRGRAHGRPRRTPVGRLRPPKDAPDNAILVGLGCAIDDGGWVVADASGRTSVPGVWVAGNVANPRAQVITAAGEGSSAAIAINADLVDEDVAAAVRDYRRTS